ncbi:hypothetical protein [Pseudoduganella violaceinigra]|uniref:hypothetical protein n=1 Tax=Pseudoduganella violaceinigra TaxID=246602 RepID=UPI0004833540|nr:hypothetical protein [Pseudoduganella violaceinigra]
MRGLFHFSQAKEKGFVTTYRMVLGTLLVLHAFFFIWLCTRFRSMPVLKAKIVGALALAFSVAALLVMCFMPR